MFEKQRLDPDFECDDDDWIISFVVAYKMVILMTMTTSRWREDSWSAELLFFGAGMATNFWKTIVMCRTLILSATA